jgi:hypothetical protein
MTCRITLECPFCRGQHEGSSIFLARLQMQRCQREHDRKFAEDMRGARGAGLLDPISTGSGDHDPIPDRCNLTTPPPTIPEPVGEQSQEGISFR